MVTTNAELETVTVTILDKQYRVSCPLEQQAALLNAAKHLDRSMREIKASGKVIGLERIAVMAALNITHELQQKQQHHTDTDDRLNKLSQRLDNLVSELDSSD